MTHISAPFPYHAVTAAHAPQSVAAACVFGKRDHVASPLVMTITEQDDE